MMRTGSPVRGVSISACFKMDSPSGRSEEHTSELQSHDNIVCRLLLEKQSKWRMPSQLAKDELEMQGDCPHHVVRSIWAVTCQPGKVELEIERYCPPDTFFYKNPAPSGCWYAIRL